MKNALQKNRTFIVNVLLIAVILTSVVLIGFNSTSLAVDGGFQVKELKHQESYVNGIEFDQIIIDTTGENVYCLQRKLSLPVPWVYYHPAEEGTAYAYQLATMLTDTQILSAVDSQARPYLMQLAVWCYMDEVQGGNNFTEEERSAIYNHATYGTYVKQLVNKAKTASSGAPATPYVNLTIDGNNMEMSKNGDYFESNLITVTTSSDVSSIQVSLDSNASQAGEIVDEGGSRKQTFNNGDKFKVRYPVANAGVGYTIDVKVVANYADYSSANTYYADGYQSVVYLFKNKQESKEASLTLSIPSTGICFAKKDSKTGKYIAGAKLKIYLCTADNCDEAKGASFLSTNTKVCRDDLGQGNYRIKEEQAPLGYRSNQAYKDFTVTADDLVGDKTVTIEIENTPTDVAVIKKDKDGNNVSGVTLQVLDETGTRVIDTWVTNGSSHHIYGLAKGSTYQIKETQAPEGYIINTTPQKFTVNETAETATQEIVVENEYTAITVSKVDASTGELVAGATLEIKDASGQVKYRVVTTKQPTKIAKIPVGTYTLQEVEAPSGYILNNNPITFQVSNDGKVQKVVLSSDYVSVNVVGNTVTIQTSIEGINFEVKTANTNESIDKWTSSSSGVAHKISNLSNGSYILTQEAVDGYKISYKEIPFDITGTDMSIMIPNDFTKVAISKRDISNEEEIPGATLQLKDSKGNVIDEWVSTDEDHLIERLPQGKYTLTETIVPDGYAPNTNEVTFEVLDSGDIQPVVFYNVPTIPVPDTAKDTPVIVYILGIIVIAGGVGIVYVNTKKAKA